MASKTRQHNVSAAQWAANGDASGQTDFMEPSAAHYGENVFGPAVQKARLPKDVYKKLQATLADGAALDPALADAVAKEMREWAMEKGATHYTHWFQPLTNLTAEKHDSFFNPSFTGDGAGARGVLRQGADPGRAGRLLVPDRRPARDVRGPRLHRVGPDVAGVRAREPERRLPLHPDRVRLLDGRGARPEDPAAALDGRAVEGRGARAEAVRRQDVRARLHDGRPGAGVLPDRRAVLLRAAGPLHHRAARCSAPSRRRATSSTSTTSARSRSACSRSCSSPSTSCAVSASRSRPVTTRSPRRSTSWRRRSRTRTSAPTTSS